MLEHLAETIITNDLLVISDEIYDRLVYGVEHIPVASISSLRDRTVTLGGFSKDYAMTGWRIGYIAGPDSIIEGIMRIHQYVMMSAPTVAQHAAIEALTSSEEHVISMREEYDRRRRFLVDGFNKIGLTCVEPHGAFYCFPDISSAGLTDIEFSEQLLLAEKVAVVPGSAFGSIGQGYIRACYATSYESLKESLIRIEHFLSTLSK